MNVKILASGSSGNSVLLNDNILIDAGMTIKAFDAHALDNIEVLIITHHHGDHMKLPLLRELIKRGITTYLPKLAMAEISKEGKLDLAPLLHNQVFLLDDTTQIDVDGVTITAYPQKHHDIVNYALVLESDKRVLYATDLDTLEPSDLGVGLLSLGNFDIILLEGNYDEVYLREYIEYMVSLVPGEPSPTDWTDQELDQWVRANYRHLPPEVSRNAFRAIQNHRHLSKQQSRAYAATRLNPGGQYYELHRSSQFYQAPSDWYQEELTTE